MTDDIWTAQLAAQLEGMTEQLRRTGEFFLDRSRDFGRDYRTPDSTAAKRNPPETLVGE